MNLLFVDINIPDINTFINVINHNTKYIIYEQSTTYNQLLTQIAAFNITSFQRLSFAFVNDYKSNKTFIGNDQFISYNNNVIVDNNVTLFIKNIITTFNISKVDFLACSLLLDNKWKLYFDFLTANNNVIIGASNDLTGNLLSGGDWILENTNENVSTIYFNENINIWHYLLDSTSHHTAVVMTDGTVKTFGRNNFGQLGNNTIINSNVPVNVCNILSGAIAVSCGDVFTTVLMSNGTVKTFGYNNVGQLGDGTNIQRNIPVNVCNITSGTIAISCGNYHAAILMTDGTVKTFGANDFGQLGDGTYTNRNIPVNVCNITSGAIAISCGAAYTTILLSNGTVKTFGLNNVGQLGDGTNINRNTPVNVCNITSNATAIFSGGAHTLILMSNGTIKTFGFNNFGQLGDGTNTNRNTPVNVCNITSGAIAITGGDRHSAVLMSNGTIKTFGYNNVGQLGDGTNTNRNTPVNVCNITSGAIAITGGVEFSAVLMLNGIVKTFGNNIYGQLGNGTNTNSNVPINVLNISTAKNILSYELILDVVSEDPNPNPINNYNPPCFSDSFLQYLNPTKPIILTKSLRNQKRMFKVGDFEMTDDHPIEYKGESISWGQYAMLHNGIEMPLDEPKYLYNFFGHPNQEHNNNKMQISDSLTVMGGYINPDIWNELAKMMNNTYDLLLNGIIDKDNLIAEYDELINKETDKLIFVIYDPLLKNCKI